MRNNLGKVYIILLLFFGAELLASTYEWSASVNKKSAYMNEAILLKYICKFSDKSELYTIDFNPLIENENLTIKLLKESETIVEGKRVNSYEYIAYVKSSGRKVFDFDMVMKKTTQESIDATIGGRDNDRDKESFSKRHMKQKSLVVEIKDSPVELVGTFGIEVKQSDKQIIKAYEPYHLEFIIKGNGNFKALKPITFKIEGVKIFSQKPTKVINLTEDGYRGTWSQKFAFVSEKDFKIPKLNIKYFDLKDEILKELMVNEIAVKVTPAYKKEELLDVSQEREPFSYDFIYYILTFIAGYFFAKIKFKRVKKVDAAVASFEAKVQSAKSLQELMMILVLKDSKKYEEVIEKIESKEIISLKDALTYV